MTRTIKNLIVAAVAALAGTSSTAVAAPIANLTLEVQPAGGGAFQSIQNLRVENGQTYSFRMLVDTAAIGTSNTQGATTRTISSLTAGTDGVNSLKFDLVQNPGSGIQVSILNAALGNGANGTATWGDGTNASAGVTTLRAGGGGNNLIGVRPVRPANAYSAINPEVFLTGQFQVTGMGNGSDAVLRGTWASGYSGGMRINGSTVLLASATTESGSDPYFGMPSLTLSPVPEPSCLGLLAVAAPLLARRSRRVG